MSADKLISSTSFSRSSSFSLMLFGASSFRDVFPTWETGPRLKKFCHCSGFLTFFGESVICETQTPEFAAVVCVSSYNLINSCVFMYWLLKC